MRRFPRARLLSGSARKPYARWNFLPRVDITSPREGQAPPPPLPSPQYLDIHGRCTLEYVDIPPVKEAQQGHAAPVTIVLVHGAPGSYNDFRHLIPKLNHPNIRIIGIDLPGYAGSKVSEEHYLDSISALPSAELALEAVKKLCEGSDNVFLVGHSFGAHAVINMAAFHATRKHKEEVKLRGTTDFSVIREQVNTLQELKMPTLVAWSQNDEFMEEEIPVELARLCHPGPLSTCCRFLWAAWNTLGVNAIQSSLLFQVFYLNGRLWLREIRPYAAKTATIVLVHGAPGSYRDFRYLIPLLAQQPGLRIIGINLPGCGDSVVEKARYVETVNALRTSEVVLEGVRQLCGTKEEQEDVFLVGHSFGAHTVMNMAALNATETQNVAIRGMALLTPAGCVPHKSLKLGPIALMVKMLKSENTWAVSAATYITKFVYTKLLRFPSNSPAELFVSAVIRTGTTDFDLIRDHAKLLGSLQTPTLVAWAKNDEHIQPEIPEELSKLCPDGPHLEFSGGGHNLQKTRADEISTAIVKWVQEVVAKDKLEVEPVSTAA
ncbi:hypothetical protein JG687_00010764 [Phytophthora cactorum]|uniref:AB hydrolase-1 domain-containing protein n=1 Tax=Phytophthora cactorum TaxID=29920 RepID=A0A8T1U5Z5_9STRA|nr:hypothetical protein JG687_00010764 [Phytophthora cactorum]